MLPRGLYASVDFDPKPNSADVKEIYCALMPASLMIGLVHRRDFRRGGQPGSGSDSERLDVAGAHLRQGCGRVNHRQIDLSSNQVLHDRRAPAIRNEAEPGAVRFWKRTP